LAVKIIYDPRKRALNLEKHGLDFEDCAKVFAGPTYDAADNRQDYGELRMRTAGLLEGRMVMVVWTPRERTRRIISMRYANGSEKARLGSRLKG
jgi:uncharacterized DUF497 family protein